MLDFIYYMDTDTFRLIGVFSYLALAALVVILLIVVAVQGGKIKRLMGDEIFPEEKDDPDSESLWEELPLPEELEKAEEAAEDVPEEEPEALPQEVSEEIPEEVPQEAPEPAEEPESDFSYEELEILDLNDL